MMRVLELVYAWWRVKRTVRIGMLFPLQRRGGRGRELRWAHYMRMGGESSTGASGLALMGL